MSSRDSTRGRGNSRGGRRDSVSGQRSSNSGGHGSGSTTPPGRSRSPQRSDSPPKSGTSSGGGQRSPSPSSGHSSTSTGPSRGSQAPRRGGQPHGPHGGAYSDQPRPQGGKANREIMFTKSDAEKAISDFEKASLESKKNEKQEPQRDLRDSKTKELRGPLKTVPLARRPGYGGKGKALNLRANFFTMTFNPKGKFFAYKLKIVPEPKLKRHVPQIYKQLVLKCDQIRGCLAATDESQWLITCNELPFNSTFARVDPDENGKYTMEYDCEFVLQDDTSIPLQGILKGLANVDIHEKISDEDYVINLLNVFMTSSAYGDSGIAIVGKGRLKYFYIDDRQEKMDLTGGIEVLRGIISSVRPAGMRLLLNLNVSNSAFYQPINLATFVNEYSRQHPQDVEMLSKYLARIKIELRYASKIYNDFREKVWRVKPIWGLAKKLHERNADTVKGSEGVKALQVKHDGAGPDAVRFFYTKKPGEPGKFVTITEFFKDKYGVTLKDKGKPVVNVGNDQKPEFIPMEVVWIAKGQNFNGELTTTQRQNIIKFSCRQPPDNYRTINTLGREIIGITKGTHFHDRGIKFSDEMVVVPARCLDAPTLKYGARSEKPQRGSWNLVGKQFTVGVTVNSWAGVWFKNAGNRTPGDQVQSAFESFKKKMGEMGVRMGQRVGLESADLKGTPLEQNAIVESTLKRWSQKGISLLLIVLPVGQERLFRFVKWMADCKLGIPNHCVLADKLAKGNPQYMANNGLKVNLKLGGVNHTLDTNSAGVLGAGKTMVVGIDATHPSPVDHDNFPTVAAVVACTDGRLGQWPGEIRIQTSKREILENLTEMMLNCLHRWQKANKSLPQNILIYRDGVSDGQYAEVISSELNAVRIAVEKLYKGPSPKITMLVVTKRHHVRFYPISADGCDDKSNCKNGTMVDRGITRPWLWDFYLQAQAPLQGSARPAHYIVMHDEIFTQNPRTAADDLQMVTHNICYMMARCTRSVSYSTPAFLADRYCDRGRKYVVAFFDTMQLHNPGYPRSKFKPEQSDIAVHPKLIDTMVYI